MLNFFFLMNLIILVPIVVYGIIISFLNDQSSKNLHSGSKWWIYTMTGFIGTPIHELSHLLFNLLFLHKVKEVSLYRPVKSKKDGVLGYVNFSYDKNSLYQNIGLFFSGIAPMIGGCAVLFLLMKFLLPDVYGSLAYTKFDNLNFFDILIKLKDNMLINIQNIFTKYGNITNLAIFLILSFSISMHMDISTEDLKTAVKGFAVIEVLLIIISVLLSAFNLTFIISFLPIVSSYILSFLTMGLIFSLISLAASYILKIV